MITIQTVNEYLELHFKSDFWKSLGDSQKTEAFEKACEDVKQALSIPETEACQIFQLCAVAEQALHIADNGEGFSSRALLFIEREKECLPESAKMDRLKYRVWDVENKKYIDPVQCMINGNGDFFYVDAANGQLYNWTEDFVVEPCSPKKDINNKSLYAGDIVIWNDGGGEPELNPEKGWIRKAVVSFDPELCFILTNDTPSGTPGNKFGFSNFMYSDTENHLKKIGTVHDEVGL